MDTYSSRTQPTGVTAVPNEANASAVSWAAVLAGAFVAAALTVTLVALGTGLGLSSVSPWSNAGVSATTIGVATIVWLILMQLVASATGGYLAGRLRTKWVDVHTDEVFFRDTAHGFLAWAVGIVIGAAFLASAAASLLGTAVQTAVPLTAAAGGAAAATAATSNNNSAGATGDRYSYYVDTMMRTTQPAAAAAGGTGGSDSSASRAEVGRIFANGMRQQNLAPADRTYLAGVIAARSGVSQAEAEQRVDQAMAQAKTAEAEAKQAADTARKAAAHLSLWTFLAFLIGAFCASYAATIGGRQRDRAVA
ncbi:MAG TPA: hypothetical protein VHQ88_18315 [Burkholderiales bacterium]|jgi:hypothetical protein|nr:hypothetical protein [Burkholderiales bacterium]